MSNKFRDVCNRKRRLVTFPTAQDWTALLYYAVQPTPYTGYQPIPYPGSYPGTLPTPAEPMDLATFNDLLEVAQRYLGTAYAWGGKSPPNFDCSGFVGYCFWSVGLIPANSASFMWYTGTFWRYFKKVDTPAPGDIVLYNGRYTGTPDEGSAHVGIYIGNGYIIDDSGGGVQYRLVTYHSRFNGYYRLPQLAEE